MCQPTTIASLLVRSIRLVPVSICWLVLLTAPVAGAEPGGDPALDEAVQKLMGLELGQELHQFQAIARAISAARTDEPVRADIEARLIGVLQGDSTELAKDYACRQLVTVGGDDAIAALSELVPNPRLSYMARFGLEGIGGPGAARALRELLDKTEGPQQIGVVISLGRLADADAVPAIAALLNDSTGQLREVCLIALGRIGTVSAARALQQSVDNLSPASPAAVDALLATAESLCRAGEHALAAEICQPLLAAESRRVREGAFRALIAAKPTESLAMIIAALAGEEDWKRVVAADCVADLREPAKIQQIAAAIPDLPAEGRVAALVSLAPRNDPAIRQAALQVARSDDADVSVAALGALIRSGTAEDIPALVVLVTDAAQLRVRQAAFETLRLMPAGGVDQALSAWFSQNADLPAVMVQLALARRSPELVPALLKAVQSPGAAARLEGWRALEIMADGQHAETLVGLLCKTSPGEERDAADRAVWLTCQRIADPAQRSAPLLAALEKGDENAPAVLLPTLARIGDQAALPALRKAMQSASPVVRDAGYRALANWPDAVVADELLEIAKTSDVEAYRIWSLRAYARLVALPSDRPAQQTFEMLRDAMKLAVRNDDKELFLSRLSAVRVPDALTLLMSYVGDPQLGKAAVSAVFTLAKGLSQTHPEQAAAALTKIQSLVDDPAIEQQIPKVLRDIEARQ